MKRGTPRHPKVSDLAVRLKIPIYSAVGLLEMLWHFTAEFALPGDIGRFSDDSIAAALCWDGASTVLVSALHEAGWLDRCSCHRLRVHDWKHHSDQTVERVLLKRNQVFLPCYDDPSTVLGSSKMPLPKAIAIANTDPSPSPPAKGVVDGKDSDLLPTSENAKRVAKMFNRRLTTAWSKKERDAYVGLGKIPEEDMTMMESYYHAEIPQTQDYRRRDLLTLLNNWPGELDRARGWQATQKTAEVLYQ